MRFKNSIGNNQEQLELQYLENEAKQKQQAEYEVLKEIEEKLERDYEYYQQIKKTDDAINIPEDSLK